jgi:hypothetical protein
LLLLNLLLGLLLCPVVREQSAAFTAVAAVVAIDAVLLSRDVLQWCRCSCVAVAAAAAVTTRFAVVVLVLAQVAWRLVL